MNINELLQWIAIISTFIWMLIALGRVKRALEIINEAEAEQNRVNENLNAALQWLAEAWRQQK